MHSICPRSATKFLQHTSSCNTTHVLYALFSLPSLPFSYNQKATYVNVHIKRMVDPYFDSIKSVIGTTELKPLLYLKNCIAQDPNGSIPISAVSKMDKKLGLPMKVSTFMRKYPSVFEEFVGPRNNLPRFKLTPKAIELDQEEKKVYETHKADLRLRLKKFIMMSCERVVPVDTIKGIQWYLGLPDGFLDDPDSFLDESFQFVDMGYGERGLSVQCEERLFSVLQENAMKRGDYSGAPREPLAFPLFKQKDLELKWKSVEWLNMFQRLPYVSPYEDFSGMYRCCDIAEKRLVGALHELLCLCVFPAIERKRLIPLKKPMGYPQKVTKLFDRHPYLFYLSLKDRTCTVILRQGFLAYTIPIHPLASVRHGYVTLMSEAKEIRRSKTAIGSMKGDPDLDLADEDGVKMAECSSV